MRTVPPTSSHEIDETLSIRNGRLWIEDRDTVTLAEQFGTPLFVISEAQLRRNYRRLRTAFADSWTHGPVQLLAAVKANFAIGVQRILADEGAGCDTYGHSELRAAICAGAAAANISVNGSVKDRTLVECALESGANITLDSERELDLVEEVATRLGRSVSVRLRIRPAFDELTESSDLLPTMSIRDAAGIYKPGIEPSLAVRLAQRIVATEGVTLTGLTVHLGRHSSEISVWAKMARDFGREVAIIARALYPWRPTDLDVGGGFPMPRDPTAPARRPAPPIESFAHAVCASLREALVDGGVSPSGIRLQVEPGRALFGNAGIHLTAVRHIKTQDRPVRRKWVEVDTTEMFLPDLIFERARFAPVFASCAARPATQSVDVVGRSCGFDILASSVAAPEVTEGDIIAFLDTGAYQDAAASNFNALGRPATVVVRGNESRLVKRRESIADVFARDVEACVD